ncbi:flagellar motor protein MotB [Roseateles violae]|uniref:Flagellar motor protein MotB n=1 Tax=Roseateles violae TaxID=3058042 RepID=A0ABT8DTN5_9BURK|nr:flagellar motor protein MotB [Pelomonas sp. PFR6]MDN3921562.1 flagellar motor protein MotB [Pelomonas sp. PFR6]
MPPKSDALHQTVVRRVSRRSEDEVHGGAWKVAFADFCLALLALFLVLWLLASRNSERMQVIMKSAGANLLEEGNGVTNSLASGSRGSMIERNPVPAYGEVQVRGKSKQSTNADTPDADPRLTKSRYETPGDMKELSRLIERVAAQTGLAANVAGIVTPQGLRLMLHDTESRGMFERGSAMPSERFKTLLRRLGPMFAQIENQMVIVGHTDALQYASAGAGGFSNSALSSHRAMAARMHLLEGGMPAASVLQVAGMAERAPMDAVNPNAAVNRRIELLILTSAQSRALAAMFGTPRESWPLVEGLEASLPAADAMRELRAKPANQAD